MTNSIVARLYLAEEICTYLTDCLFNNNNERNGNTFMCLKTLQIPLLNVHLVYEYPLYILE